MGMSFSKFIGGVVAGASLLISGLGFTPLGIAAGSVAAAIQSGIGNVVAGSSFAVMQSLGASGAFVAAGTTGAVVAVAGHAFEGSAEDEAAGNEDNPFGGGNLDSLKPSRSKSFRAEGHINNHYGG